MKHKQHNSAIKLFTIRPANGTSLASVDQQLQKKEGEKNNDIQMLRELKKQMLITQFNKYKSMQCQQRKLLRNKAFFQVITVHMIA